MNPVWHFVNGVAVMGPLVVSNTTITSTATLSLPAGSDAAVALNFGTAGTGIYSTGATGFSFSAGGAGGERWRLDNGNWTYQASVIMGWSSAAPSVGADTTMSRLAAGQVSVAGGSTPAVAVTGANAQRVNISQATTSLTTNSGIGTATATNLIPAGSLVVGVSVRVTTTISGAGGLTSMSIGDGSDADRWGAAIALASGTTTTLANATISTAPIYAAATSVVLTANAGQFDAGVIRITVHYLSLTAPSS